jgi:hypothetical protein
MGKNVLEKDSFEANFIMGFGANGTALEKTALLLNEFGISQRKFLKYLNNRYVRGAWNSWNYIDFDICIKNYLMEKFSRIVSKHIGFFEAIPLFLHHDGKSYFFKGIEDNEKFIEKHCLEEKSDFIKKFKVFLTRSNENVKI